MHLHLLQERVVVRRVDADQKPQELHYSRHRVREAAGRTDRFCGAFCVER